MLAFFGNLSTWELLLVLVIAILVFGRRLPQVAAQGAYQVNKLRRQLSAMWRDTGLSQEWHTLQREVDQVRRFDPLRGEPPRKRPTWEQKALPDQLAAQEAADLAARQAPEVPWSGDELGPAPEEARAEPAASAPGEDPSSVAPGTERSAPAGTVPSVPPGAAARPAPPAGREDEGPQPGAAEGREPRP